MLTFSSIRAETLGVAEARTFDVVSATIVVELTELELELEHITSSTCPSSEAAGDVFRLMSCT
jgi:hypothetical protein